MSTNIPTTVYLKSYRPPAYKVKHIDLDIRIFNGKTFVRARTQFVKNHEGDDPLVLDGRYMKLLSVTLDGQKPDYRTDDNFLTISVSGKNEFIVETETETCPEENTRLEGLYNSGGTYCTQCEAEGFRTITYFPDRPDVMATFTTRIEADKKTCPVLLSNGNLKEEGDLPNGRHFAVWDDPFPKPCYLFALVAGDLVYIQDRFKTMSGRTVDLRIYVRNGDQSQCHHAMESLKKSMKWDEDIYGREYQFERFNIVAVSDFNMGAMENTSLNIFNTALVLAHPETATDSDFERVEGVIAHEYFHNWTGNRITCRDWFQLSLKEGLTVFRDQEFSADMNSRGVKRIEDVQMLRRMQFAEDAGALAHPVRPDNYMEINNFYTVTVYEKGAELIRMQRTLLGAETYRKATDLYFKRHDGQAVTCEDFVQCMEDASSMDLSQFFLWYQQAGTPEITAKTRYDEKARTFSIELSQHIPPTPGQKDKKPMHIPVAIGLVGPNGHDFDLGKGQATKILHLKEKTQKFVFEDIPARPVPSILRNFSAPVKLISDLSDDDLQFLMIHDSDGFNRWESGQTYALRIINRALDQHETKKGDFEIDSAYIASLSALLNQAFQPGADKALVALSMALPDIAVIGQSRKQVDPQAIYDVREAIIKTVVRQSRHTLERIYNENRTAKEFKNDFQARAQRSLQNAALRYLSRDNHDASAALAKAQYDSANNMTDRVAALSVLAETKTRARDEAFADFYNRFRAYPLVIDKWFALQAAAVRSDTLEGIKKLKTHPDFILKNPNRVRSLYSAFAMSNPVCFHDETGGGYAFLADAIIELNAINPQIAARLLTPMRDWNRYTPDRQQKMKAALERIAAMPDLSRNVFEIVSKTLAA